MELDKSPDMFSLHFPVHCSILIYGQITHYTMRQKIIRGNKVMQSRRPDVTIGVWRSLCCDGGSVTMIDGIVFCCFGRLFA